MIPHYPDQARCLAARLTAQSVYPEVIHWTASFTTRTTRPGTELPQSKDARSVRSRLQHVSGARSQLLRTTLDRAGGRLAADVEVAGQVEVGGEGGEG
eukprot:3931987-Rhodomonas_salina.1